VVFVENDAEAVVQCVGIELEHRRGLVSRRRMKAEG
jgi:hypothetical protein